MKTERHGGMERKAAPPETRTLEAMTACLKRAVNRREVFAIGATAMREMKTDDETREALRRIVHAHNSLGA